MRESAQTFIYLVILREFSPVRKGKEDGNISLGIPDGSVVKNLSASAGDMDSIPGLGRSPGEGNGNPLCYSCLRNPMDRGAGRSLQCMGSQKSRS